MIGFKEGWIVLWGQGGRRDYLLIEGLWWMRNKIYLPLPKSYVPLLKFNSMSDKNKAILWGIGIVSSIVGMVLLIRFLNNRRDSADAERYPA